MELDKDAFREWVESHQSGMIGLARNACDCPIATYMKSLDPGKPISVDGVWWRYLRASPSGEYPGYERLPNWAIRFIGQIDQHENELVSRDNALAILDLIDEEIARG